MAYYRPTLLLSVFLKIFEKVFQMTLLSCFNENNVLAPKQIKFTRNCSTQDADLSLYAAIVNNLIINYYKSTSLFFDFEKVFGVSHELLLNILSSYGIRNPAQDWIRIHLSLWY